MGKLPFSTTQTDRLSERLRKADTISDRDLDMLHALLSAYDTTLQAVAEELRAIGLDPTTRLKTTGTIVDKLRREAPITLRGIRDLAGARIVRRMTLDEQDRIRDQLLDHWPGAKHLDRRSDPNHGYRALHVVPRVDGCQVEIQVRTYYQDTWAQVMEWVADRWGRQIRYGGEPFDPRQPMAAEGSLTRGEMVELWQRTSADIAELEVLENRRARLLRVLPPKEDLVEDVGGEEELEALDEEIDRRFGVLRQVLRETRETFGLPT